MNLHEAGGERQDAAMSTVGCARPILEPDRVLFAAVHAVFGEGTLGVLVPIPERREAAAARWGAITSRLAIAATSPYAGGESLLRAAEELKRSAASLIVMDCMGFTPPMKALVRVVTGAPVLLPGSLMARFVAEVV